MKEYRFYIYLTLDGEITGVFHSVSASSYRNAYRTLLSEIPHKFSCDCFVVNPSYRVNGKRRVAR